MINLFLNKYLKSIYLISILILSGFQLQAAVPTVGTITSNKINVNTGINYIIVNGISDGDPTEELVSVTATSSNSSLLSVIGVTFTSGSSVAIVEVQEFGVMGNVDLTVNANDGSNTSKVFPISINNFYQNGVDFGLYDIVFWQYTTPVAEVPVYKSIIPTLATPLTNPNDGNGNGPENTELFNTLPLTVGFSDNGCCGSSFKGTGYTTSYRGVFIPTVTGLYIFDMDLQDGGEFVLRTDQRNTSTGNDNLKKLIIKRSGKNEFTSNISDTAYLIANKAYGFYSSNWVVFSERFRVRYKFLGTNTSGLTYKNALEMGFVTTNTPGYNASLLVPNNIILPGANNDERGYTDNDILKGKQVFPAYDLIKPTIAGSLIVKRKSTNSIDLIWGKATDNNKVSGYNIYLNGFLSFNKSDINDTTLIISNLSPNTLQTIFVTAVDFSGNESEPTNLIIENTYPVESDVPSSPSNIVVTQLADMSALISWDASSDAGSGIYGYKIFLDNFEYSKDTIVENSVIIKTLKPNTYYAVGVAAIDGNKNVSSQTPIDFTTLDFDPNIVSPGVKKLAVNVSSEYIGWNDGFGLNAEYETSNYTTGEIGALYREFRPSIIRWGALGANTMSYSSRAGLNSPNGASFAKFVNFANTIGARASIVIGTDNNPRIDWRQFPALTAGLFYQYLNDSIGSEAELRIAEGYNGSLIKASKGIVLEFGNEPWGGTSNGVGVDHNADSFNDYEIYRKWARPLAIAFKNIPNFDSTKVKLAISGRDPNPGSSFGLTEKMLQLGTTSQDNVDRLDWISVSGYLDGNFVAGPGIAVGKSELDYYRSGLETMVKHLKGFEETMDIDYDFQKRVRPFFLYESSMSRADFNNRVGQGLIMTDYFLSSMKNGVADPVVFALKGGQWGIVGTDGTKFPFFVTSKMVNWYLKESNILKVNNQSIEKVFGLSTGELPIDPVSVNVYQKGSKYSVCLISRDFENDFQVKVNLPSEIQVTNSVGKMYILTSPGFSSFTSGIDSSNVNVSNGMIVKVPKYSMVIVSFEGTPITNQIPLPIGYTKYKKVTSLDIVDSSAQGSDLVTPAYLTLSPVIAPLDARFTDVRWKITTDNAALKSLVDTTTADNKFLLQNVGCIAGINEVINFTVTGVLADNPNYRKTLPFTLTVAQDENFEDCPVSTKKFVDQSVSVYPNPSKGRVNVKTDNGGTIVVTNALGTVVLKEVARVGGVHTLSDLSKGVYFMNITTPKGVATKKVVID